MLRRGRSVFLALGVLALLAVASPAASWDLDKMNQTINQTNFVLDNICSATLISVKEKLALTNYHCVDTKIRVVEREERQADGTLKKIKREKYEDVTLAQKSYQGFNRVGAAEYEAEIVAHKRSRDLAILKLKADTIPHTVESKLLPADKKLTRGEKVYAVGNPAMLDASVVTGVVSSLNRTFEVPWTDERLPWIQMSAPLAGGNSGGALYNDEGYLIGVPAAGMRQEHLSFAIPTNPLVHELLRESCYASIYDPKADDAKCRAEKESKAKKAGKATE